MLSNDRLGITSLGNLTKFIDDISSGMMCKRAVYDTTKNSYMKCEGTLYIVEDATSKARESGKGGEFCATVACNGGCHSVYEYGDNPLSKRDRLNMNSGNSKLVTKTMSSIGRSVMCCHIMSGPNFFQSYHNTLSLSGMDGYCKSSYQRLLPELSGVMAACLLSEIKATKDFIQAMSGDGPWDADRLVTACDGSWSTAGATSPHGCCCIRAPLLDGAILYFETFSRNDPEHPYLGTSASMEAVGAYNGYSELACDGFGLKEHKTVIDGDTCTGACFMIVNPHGEIKACCCHKNKAFGKNITTYAGRKSMKGIKGNCECAGKDHTWTAKPNKEACGCIRSRALLRWGKKHNEALTQEAGKKKDPCWYVDQVNMLKLCVQDIHTMTDKKTGKITTCWHHDATDEDGNE
jgi:hypothetical protein